MARPKYTLTIRWTGEYYEVSIPEIAGTARGATFSEAVDNAHIAISAARIEAAESSQRRRKAKAGIQHTVA